MPWLPTCAARGQTDRPEAIDQFTLLHLVGDMLGLLDALGHETAVIAGHDWGLQSRGMPRCSVPIVSVPSSKLGIAGALCGLEDRSPRTPDCRRSRPGADVPGYGPSNLYLIEKRAQTSPEPHSSGMRPLDSARATAGSKRSDHYFSAAAVTVRPQSVCETLPSPVRGAPRQLGNQHN
jgi:hypothetical protein